MLTYTQYWALQTRPDGSRHWLAVEQPEPMETFGAKIN